jgi:DNA-binding response OmpR family regulator
MSPDDIGGGVILAENDTLLRGTIRSVLLHTKKQIFLAADGLEAIGLARQFKAQLVLLDIGMPRLNGLEACKVIRALPGYADVPIVMLTGHNDVRLHRAAQRLGANDFITKPFRPDMLLARLATYLDMPAPVGPPVAAHSNRPDALLGGRSQVWGIPEKPGVVPGNQPQLNNGREMLRIYRNAERKP